MSKKFHSTIALLMAIVMVLTNVNYVHATEETVDDLQKPLTAEEMMEQKLEEYGWFYNKSNLNNVHIANASSFDGNDKGTGDGNDKGTGDGNDNGTGDGVDIPTGDHILHSGELHGIVWYIDKDGVLTITGTNTSNQVELEEDATLESVAPWSVYSDEYTKVVINAKNVKTTYGWFLLNTEITEIDMSKWDTSTVEDMTAMFFGCSNLKSLDVSNWNTSKVKSMSGTFGGCTSLTSLDLSNLDVSAVKNMNSMFYFSALLTSINMTGWDTSAVEDMNSMFSFCVSMPSIDVSKFNTTAVKSMAGMFTGCASIKELNLSSFDTSNVESLQSMFAYCESLTNLDITHFNTQKVQNMAYVFYGCTSLTTLDVTKLNTSNVTEMYGMFYECTGLTTLDVSNFDTTKLVEARYMFEDCTSLESIKAFRNLKIEIDLPVSPMYDDKYNTYEDIFPMGLNESVTLLKTSPMEGKMWVTEVAPQTYTGKAIKPAIKVYDGPTLLKEKVDYTVSYKNNKNVNDASNVATAPTIIVKGKGNYTGQEKVTFQIVPINLNDEKVVAKDIYVNPNNKEQKPVPTITYNKKKLKNNTDFTLSYTTDGDDAYTAVGNYTITAKGTGNYTGERNISLVITNGTLMNKVKVAAIPKQNWTGKPVEPDLNVTYKGSTLVKGTDYTVEFDNNINSGKATATVIGMGNYAGTKDVTFQIVGFDISKANVNGIVDKIYNGEEQEQDFVISVNGETLTEADYDVTYSKNINAGKASMIITGKGKYSGTLKTGFTIKPYDIAKDELDLITGLYSLSTREYIKGGVTLDTPPKFNGVKMVEKKDYTVSYKNNKSVYKKGKYGLITIKGKGNFTGTKKTNLYIYEKSLNSYSRPITVVAPDVAYSAKPGKFATKPVLYDTNGKKLSAGTDYDKNFVYTLEDGTILDKKTAIPPIGTVIYVTIKGKGNYDSSITTSYRITQASFNSAKVNVITPKVYTGKAVTLDKDDLVVTMNGTTLTYGVDYEIVEGTYTNNVKKGTASVTIKGLGNYGGTKTVKYKIASKTFVSFWKLLFG